MSAHAPAPVTADTARRQWQGARVAIVSDSLFTFGGAERVQSEIMGLFPQADLFALVDFVPAPARAFLQGKPVQTTFIQRLPGARRHFRKLLPLWPVAIEQFDLSAYDLVISNHWSVAHGVITAPGQLHLSYTQSPMRYAWDQQHQYLREMKLARGLGTILARSTLHRARMWDAVASMRVDNYAANSNFVRQRIRKYYRRDATVVYPPVAVDDFVPSELKDNHYLYFGRIVPYKRVDLLVDAFARMPARRLVIAGDGPDRAALAHRATPNVTFLGRVEDAAAKTLLARAKAYIYPAIEDFGIAPLEAQASGTPVIAFHGGGLAETIQGLESAAPTGMFFHAQTVEAVIQAVHDFETIGGDIRPLDCRRNAERFRPERFRDSFANFLTAAANGADAGPETEPGPSWLAGRNGTGLLDSIPRGTNHA